MLVIHISLTPLAGAPIRIVNALNTYTQFNSRLINLNAAAYGLRKYPEDLIWETDKELCIELIKDADILHFHHYFDISSQNNPFKINFVKLSQKAKIVRHFHSDYDFLNKQNINFLKEDNFPKIVIPHCPERTFLDAFIVPNIIPINDPILSPKENHNSILQVFFSASSPTSMWHERWNTKGLPEVEQKFKQLKKNLNFEFNIIQNTPYIKCQKLKQKSDIVIGDTTSGSYHLTDLEALSQGKPTFTYLDGRSIFVLQNLLKCNDMPFINTRIEEIDLPFYEIVRNELLRKEIGAFSRGWVEKYYNDKKLVNFFVKAYIKLLNDEPLVCQDYLKFHNAKTFLYNTLYDFQWQTRKQNNKIKIIKLPKFLINIVALFIFNKERRHFFKAKYAK